MLISTTSSILPHATLCWENNHSNLAESICWLAHFLVSYHYEYIYIQPHPHFVQLQFVYSTGKPIESWAPQIKTSLRQGVVPPSLQWATGQEFKGPKTCGHVIIGKGIPQKTSIFLAYLKQNSTYCAITAPAIQAINASAIQAINAPSIKS